MAITLFGFEITRSSKKVTVASDPTKAQTFAPEENLDGSLEVAAVAGAYGTYLDINGGAAGEAQTITRYREMVMFPECEYAVDDICNEAIVMSEDKPIVTLQLDSMKGASKKIKTAISAEFDEILQLLDFRGQGYEIFRRWYVDGRVYYHIVIDVSSPKGGILELRYIDPRKIRKVKQIQPIVPLPGVQTDVPLVMEGKDYFIYNQYGLEVAKNNTSKGETLKIASDSIAFVHSGLLDPQKTMVVSHLHKALKSYNQLKMLEDAVVIYRISRAPERRIFYVDVGNLPKIKAEQYLRDIMVKFKNRVVYNSATGEVSDDREHRTMLEDYWLPRREGGRGTEISTLPGGQNLGEIDDILYFRKKLYKAMNVPQSRLESDGGFNIGRSSEITRDEVKFGKFVARLRHRFQGLFITLLGRQLRLKGVVTDEDWDEFKTQIGFQWETDSHFVELQDAEMITSRVELLGSVDSYKGEYFSKEWICKNVLRQTAAEIRVIEKQIKKEIAAEDELDDDDEDENSNNCADRYGQSIPKPLPEPEGPKLPKKTEVGGGEDSGSGESDSDNSSNTA